jgi:hypothetical protein
MTHYIADVAVFGHVMGSTTHASANTTFRTILHNCPPPHGPHAPHAWKRLIVGDHA